ncbi:MAG: hypothetical protein C7B45_09010 [Sulfobacillus acidophilus]|uniref:Uncharacterized protein n=1 Tax=Sulfobacillus acidophilus TaxID=53633 RepID=A0A2T2WI45_9FIRM|nr:MAG: hypothetical protein C7B45_09010 [Sulfobacillus acidophilus]
MINVHQALPGACARNSRQLEAPMRTILRGGRILTDHGLIDATLVILGTSIESIVPRSKAWHPRPEDEVIDCTGLVVAPGLVDMHSHDDIAVTHPALAEAKIRQGVTTTAIAMDGFGCAPLFGPHLDEVVQYWKPVNGDPGPWVSTSLAEQARRYAGHLGLNVILNVPHANLRILATGFDNRPLQGQQLLQATQSVADALDEGAAGLTTGLSYVPAVFSAREELVALARPLRRQQRPYISHLRDYGTKLFEAVEEALTIGEELDIPVHLSHLHLSHPTLFGQADALLETLHQAMHRGIRVTWDLYPYSAGSSILHAYLPVWLTEGGPAHLMNRLHDPKAILRLAQDPSFAGFDWSRVVIASTASGRYVGESITAIAQKQQQSPASAIAQLLVSESLDISCIVHQTDPADDDLLAQDDAAMVGSDGLPFGQRPHPRYFGAFAAFFAHHVKDLQMLTLEQAWRKMSTGSALYRISDRGRLAAGAAADIAVFDPETYAPQSTYELPQKWAQGVHHVFINGTAVLQDGIFFPDAKPGQVLTPN